MGKGEWRRTGGGGLRSSEESGARKRPRVSVETERGWGAPGGDELTAVDFSSPLACCCLPVPRRRVPLARLLRKGRAWAVVDRWLVTRPIVGLFSRGCEKGFEDLTGRFPKKQWTVAAQYMKDTPTQQTLQETAMN